MESVDKMVFIYVIPMVGVSHSYSVDSSTLFQDTVNPIRNYNPLKQYQFDTSVRLNDKHELARPLLDQVPSTLLNIEERNFATRENNITDPNFVHVIITKNAKKHYYTFSSDFERNDGGKEINDFMAKVSATVFSIRE